MHKAVSVFVGLNDPDEVSLMLYNIHFVYSKCKDEHTESAFSLFPLMEGDGLVTDRYTLNTLIDALWKDGEH